MKMKTNVTPKVEDTNVSSDDRGKRLLAYVDAYKKLVEKKDKKEGK